MSPDTYVWVLVVHVVGFVLWVGGMLACMALLHVHSRVEEPARGALTATEKRMAIIMDLGATLAIVCGLLLALKGPVNEFKHGSWLHIKLTAVVLGLLSSHGIVRAKIKKFSRGDIKPLSTWMPSIALAAAAIAATLGANVTLLR